MKNYLRLVMVFLMLALIAISCSPRFKHNKHSFVEGSVDIVNVRLVDKASKDNYAYVIKIMRDLKAQDPFFNEMIVHLGIVDSTEVNAYSSSYKGGALVSITTGALGMFNGDKDYIAIILGHELGHIRHGDVFRSSSRSNYCSTSNKNNRQCEKDADIYGQHLANRALYRGCRASELMLLFKRTEGEIGPNEDHPQYQERANYLRCN